jgi:hypothetical protein
MTPQQAIAFVRAKGIVLESGRGPVPNLAEAIAGESIRGSWWAHAQGKTIFRCSRAVRDSPEVLVCRVVGGKITYIHRRLWPALVRLAKRFTAEQLAVIEEVHTPSGKHQVKVTSFRKWIPDDVAHAAARLDEKDAASLLSALPIARPRKGQRR